VAKLEHLAALLSGEIHEISTITPLQSARIPVELIDFPIEEKDFSPALRLCPRTVGRTQTQEGYPVTINEVSGFVNLERVCGIRTLAK
jgi:hypothetical protein